MNRHSPHRLGMAAAITTLLGIVVSGPLALLVVNATHPQPPWQDAALYARSYHPVQVFPYLGGLLLVVGLVLLVTSVHALADRELKPRTGTAQILAAVFATFIFFNYVVQTTYLPTLVTHYDDRYAATVSMFSMSNPNIAGVGDRDVGVRVHRRRYLARGAGVPRQPAGTADRAGVRRQRPGEHRRRPADHRRPGWVMTVPGLAAFAGWNLLLAAMAALALAVFRRRRGTRADSARGQGGPAEIAPARG